MSKDEFFILGVCGLLVLVIVVPFVFYTYFTGRRREELERQRMAEIQKHQSDWGEAICNLVIARKIDIGMTADMVLLSWGRPSAIDNQEITSRGKKERWIYGTPRRGARYVWFADGKITKLKAT